MTNPADLKILLVDNAADRKTRISLLKNHGFTVYPALDLRQAQQRCKRGRFDLIVVNSEGAPELALEVCDRIKTEDPNQPLILIAAPGMTVPERDFAGSGQPELLLQRIRATFEAGRKALAA
jgi:CheY-like chemotaxis protein